MQLPPPGLSKLNARTYHHPAPAPAPAQRQPAPAGASGRATADEPDGRGDEQQREREQPAALDPLERPEPAVGLVSGQLGVAVLDEVAHGVDACPGVTAWTSIGRSVWLIMDRLAGWPPRAHTRLSTHAGAAKLGLVVTSGAS